MYKMPIYAKGIMIIGVQGVTFDKYNSNAFQPSSEKVALLSAIEFCLFMSMPFV